MVHSQSRDERDVTGFGAPGRQRLNPANLIGLTPTCLAPHERAHTGYQHTHAHILYYMPISRGLPLQLPGVHLDSGLCWRGWLAGWLADGTMLSCHMHTHPLSHHAHTYTHRAILECSDLCCESETDLLKEE